MTVIKRMITRGLAWIRKSKARLCVVEIVLLFLAARLFIYTGYVRYSPEKAAEAFAVKLLNADYDSIYKKLELSGNEDEFTSKEAFVNVQQAMQTRNFTNCNIEETYSENNFVQKFLKGTAFANKGRENVTIPVCFTDREGETYHTEIRMSLSDSKKLLMFRNWKPDLTDYIVNDFTISVPKGAAVTVGGVNIPAEYLKEETSESAAYVIPQIFRGYYEVTVTKENMEDITTTINTEEGSYRVDTMSLKPEIMQEAVDQAAADLKKIYKAAFEGKDESGLNDISILPECAEEVTGNYLYLAEQIRDGNKLSLAVGEIQPEAYYYHDNGVIYMNVNLNYDYSEVYEVAYWGGEVSNQSYEGNKNAEFTYSLDGTKMQLINFSNLELY